jgi:sarcosine oxidase subunit beta
MMHDVVVVGGGVTGCAVARSLALDCSVTLLERGDIAAGATGRAAGMITVRTAHRADRAVADHALAFFGQFDGTEGFDYHPEPSLELVTDDISLDVMETEAAGFRADGVDARALSGADAVARHPCLRGSAFTNAVEFVETGWLDPPALAEALASDATDRGATVRTGVDVEGIETSDGTVTGVRTSDGGVPADTVVVAAGWRTPDLVAERLPVRPYHTQLAVYDLPGVTPPMGWLPERGVYFRPTDAGHLLVGGGSAFTDAPESEPRTATDGFLASARETVEAIFDVADPELLDSRAGVDAATPDGFPIVDAPASSPDGLVLATGLHGRGVMTAPVTATTVRSLVLDEPTPFDRTRFALDRFESRSTDFTFVDVSA